MNWISNLVSNPVSKDAVSTLVERIKTAPREERKKAVSDLKKVSADPKYTKEIGQAIDVLLGVIKSDKQDLVNVATVMEILRQIMSKPESTKGATIDPTPYIQNVMSFVKEKENVSLLLGFLDEPDKNVKYQTIKLLTVILSVKHQQGGGKHDSVHDDSLLLSPIGIPGLVDMLAEPDLIRNECLLLLKELTKSNQEIQKIVAFAGAFESLFSIMSDEQMGNGGIVVQDCLSVINNLLRGNLLLVNHFRESGCISKFAPLLDLDQSDMWILTDDKTEILLLALETVSLVVTTSNPQDNYTGQTVLKQTGVLDQVLKLALGGINSPGIRSKALWTLGHVIRGHQQNSAHFRDSEFASLQKQKQQHSVLRVLSIIFTSKVYKERRAGLHTIQCYLHDNEDAQLAIASTLTPPPVSLPMDEEETVGRIILRTLTNWETDEDNLRAWYACIILSYIIHGSRLCKEKLLKIQLDIPASGTTGGTETLFTKTIKELIKSIKTKADMQIQVGFLRLLSVWTYDCPAAIQAFFQQPSHSQFLVELLGQSSTNIHVAGLCSLVIGLCLQDDEGAGAGVDATLTQKIGIDKYEFSLEQIVKSEDFVNAEQGKSHMHTEDLNKLMFYDYDYTLFFRRALQQVMSRVKPNSVSSFSSSSSSSSITTASPSSDKHIQFYEDKLKEQDLKIKNYETKINQLNLELSALSSSNSGDGNSQALISQIQQQSRQVQDRDIIISDLRNKISVLERMSSSTEGAKREMDKLREENNDLKQSLEDAKQKRNVMKKKVNLLEEEKLTLQTRVLNLEKDMQSNASIGDDNLQLLYGQIENLQKQLTEANAKNQEAIEKKQEVESEQEELLVVLAERSILVKKLKEKLRNLKTKHNEQITESDQDDEEDEEEEDDGNEEN
eukprot:TRINITY_DN1506_c3_g1_i1.p1 TRINITY_DN1506_c3_g1~~TRINITY_DN1506_c3_g1_i1.p1  ORF type:complete len:897 (-),score=251.85 TRINITY_DN1506_c3_g1_i1:301-2991(-)